MSELIAELPLVPILIGRPLQILLGLTILGLAAVSLIGWSMWIAARVGGLGWRLEVEPRQQATWGLVDLVAIGFVWILLQAGSIGVAHYLGWTEGTTLAIATETEPAEPAEPVEPDAEAQRGGPAELAAPEAVGDAEPARPAAEGDAAEGDAAEGDGAAFEPAKQMRVVALIQSSQLVAMLLGSLWIMVRCGVGPGAIGWSLRQAPYDLLLGVAAAILFMPLVYVLMLLAVQGLDQEYSHPVLEMVGKDLWLLPFAIWAAVIVAPITEEFAFRVLLQGYLESLARGRLSIEKIVVGSPAVMVQRVAWWPMIVSSVLFGLAHFGYGPSWLPLIFLGLVLGGLFRATGRVWASTALHVIFNSFAMLSLAVQIIAS